MRSNGILKILLLPFLFSTFLFSQKDFDINLEVISFEELMNMTVTAASKKSESINDAPGIISVISSNEIKNFAVDNLGEVLEMVTGSVFLSANVFTDNLISLRGQTTTPYNNHVLILINGRPIRDPISGGLNNVMYNSFPLNIIDKIEIIRGPGSVLYGSCAYSGVINVVTKSVNDNKKSFTLEAKGGTYGSLGGSFTTLYNKDDFNLNFSANYFKDDGPMFGFTDYLNVTSNANFDKKVFGLYFNTSYKNFSLNAFYGHYKPYSLAGEDNNWDITSDPYDNNIHNHYFIDAQYSQDLSEKIELNLNTTFNRRNWTTNGDEVLTGNDLLFEGLFKANYYKNNELIVGGTFSLTDWTGVLLLDNDLNNASIFAQMDYYLIEEIKLIGGFQWNKIENIEGNFSPRLGLIANFTEEFGGKLLYSQAFRRGYPLETSFAIPVFRGNLELEPEIIKTTELQFFYQSEIIQTSITGYYSKMSDIISRVWFPDPEILPYEGFLQYINKGEHKFWGIELEGKFSLMDNLILTGSFAYQTNENEDGVDNATLHPNIYVKLGLLYQDEIWSGGIFNGYYDEPTQVSKVNPDVAEVNKVPESFDLLSAKIAVNPFKLIDENSNTEFKVYIKAYNLLDQDIRYPEYTSRGVNSLLPLSEGRRIFAGFTYEF